MTTPAAAARLRTLPTLGSPIGVYTDQAPWRARRTHNSISVALRAAIAQMADVTPAEAGSVFGAAKQAGPPRGVPR